MKPTLTISQALALNFKALRALTESLNDVLGAVRTLREERRDNSSDELDALNDEILERVERTIETVSAFFNHSKVWEDMENAVSDLMEEVSNLGYDIREAKRRRERLAQVLKKS